MKVVTLRDIWEMYRIRFAIDGKSFWENFWALKGISFDIEEGETVGVIGENGAGKSTMLKIIAGALKPDRGEIKVSGRVCGLLELGAGLQPELTGRDNIYLNANLFGLNKSQIEEKYQDIVDLSSLGRFIHAPVRSYSQGMFVRLAFSVAINMDPDILLIDDILVVGDVHFQRKCIKKIFELKEQGKTIIFVTHDMNALTRLCERVIFLKEGRMVKDGLAESVVPLYTQMVGSRDGVGILESSPLNLVFNNGRLFINWQDKLITPNAGIHTAFCVVDRWYGSIQAKWEVEKEGENRLTARGKIYDLGLTQVWRLEITDNYEVKWNIEVELDEFIHIQEGYVKVMLASEYQRWFTTLESGEFPSADYDGSGGGFLADNVFRKCIGVEKQDTANGNFPSLVLECSRRLPTTLTQVLNLSHPNNCRVLQYKVFDLHSYSDVQSKRFIHFSGKLLLGNLSIENYLKKAEDEFILSNGRLKIIFNDGKGALSYDGIDLTEAGHMCTSVHARGRWYSSSVAQWEVKKAGKNKIIAKGIWRNLPIVQIWEIEIKEDDSFSWKVDMDIKEAIEIQEQRAQLMCPKKYKYYLSDYGEGDFFDEFLENEVDMLQRCIPDGRIGLQSPHEQIPAIKLNFSKNSDNFAKILNADFYNKTRILRIQEVTSEENLMFLPQRYRCFDIEVSLEKDSLPYPKEQMKKLQGQDLSFNFDGGKGCVYWRGIELTKGIGLYTSIRSRGRWHDSYSGAIWKIDGDERKVIKAQGRWLYLPLSQYWEIILKDNGMLEFNIKMKVDRKIEVDRLQTNLMLLEKYCGWIADEEKGLFPSFKKDVDDDWDCVWKGDNNTQKVAVTVRGDHLPLVALSPHILDKGWRLNIVNSDICHRGRVLQCLNSEKRIILPDEHHYFRGEIVVSSNDKNGRT